MANYMGNSRPKRVRTYSSKRSRYRKSSTGQLRRDVYSRYSRTGTPSLNRIKKPMINNSNQTMPRMQVSNTNQGLKRIQTTSPKPINGNDSVMAPYCSGPAGQYGNRWFDPACLGWQMRNWTRESRGR